MVYIEIEINLTVLLHDSQVNQVDQVLRVDGTTDLNLPSQLLYIAGLRTYLLGAKGCKGRVVDDTVLVDVVNRRLIHLFA